MAFNSKVSPLEDTVVSADLKKNLEFSYQPASTCYSSTDTSFSFERREIKSAVNNAISHRIGKDFARNLLLLAIPLVALCILSVITSYRTIEMSTKAEETLSVVKENFRTVYLVTALQRESGVSGFLISKRKQINIDDALKLGQARNTTNNAFAEGRGLKFDEFTVNNTVITTISELYQLLLQHRENEDKGHVSGVEAIKFYTSVTAALRRSSLQRSTMANSGAVWPLLVAQDNLLRVVDFYGITRSLGLLYFASCKLSPENLAWFLRAQGRGDFILDGAEVYYEDFHQTYGYYLDLYDASEELMDDGIDLILQNENACETLGFEKTSRQTLYWFDNITNVIQAVLSTREVIAEEINIRSSVQSSVAKWTTALCIGGLLVTLGICIACGAWFARESYKTLAQIGKHRSEMLGACGV
ncbi:hypothetical protein HOLleu_39204 [Holothuria leucospilota]|uniref:Nitrate/nitrite sensing protein domain-containing protein n=1 Tax=Holothuria leucospilota TaxID=206669 RepID=A0A9Q0YI24_HOLLE|nr:hypothetical protein HOLleu_39204 [Holothuria leucospilota]